MDLFRRCVVLPAAQVGNGLHNVYHYGLSVKRKIYLFVWEFSGFVSHYHTNLAASLRVLIVVSMVMRFTMWYCLSPLIEYSQDDRFNVSQAHLLLTISQAFFDKMHSSLFLGYHIRCAYSLAMTLNPHPRPGAVPPGPWVGRLLMTLLSCLGLLNTYRELQNFVRSLPKAKQCGGQMMMYGALNLFADIVNLEWAPRMRPLALLDAGTVRPPLVEPGLLESLTRILDFEWEFGHLKRALALLPGRPLESLAGMVDYEWGPLTRMFLDVFMFLNGPLAI